MLAAPTPLLAATAPGVSSMPWLTLACLVTMALAIVIMATLCMSLSRSNLESRYYWVRSARALASLSVLLGVAISMKTVFQLRNLSVDFGSSFAVGTLVTASLPLVVALGAWCMTFVSMRRCVRMLRERQAAKQTENFSVEIKGRGEGLEYRDEDGTFIFEISLGTRPMELHAYDCRDVSFQPRTLTDAQRSRIIPRIVIHMDPWQQDVKVLTDAPEQPLPRLQPSP